MSAPDPVIIVGAGAAGATAARTLLARDPEVRVVLVGEEPERPYDRTQLSKAVLTGERDEPTALYASDLADDRLELLTDRAVTAIEREAREVVLADGTRRRYRALVLACGAAPRQLPLSGTELPGVHLVRARPAADALRTALEGATRLVVIGGGLIGLEVAAAARARGVAVTVLEVADQLLGRVLPQPVATVVADAHRAQGVTLRLGVTPTGITGTDRATGVSLADGDHVPADVVVVAVGARPRTELAAAAGLVVEDGVLVDAQLRTADRAIWAAGDVVRRRDERTGAAGLRTEAWSPALAMGQHVAVGILGAETPFTDVPWMWSDQYDLTVQAAGRPVGDGTQVLRGDPEQPTGLAVFALESDRVVGVAGVARGSGIGRVVRGAVPLIEHGIPVTAEELADPGVDLRKLARERR